MLCLILQVIAYLQVKNWHHKVNWREEGNYACEQKMSLASFMSHHRSFQIKIILDLEIEKHFESHPSLIRCYSATSRTYEIINKQRRMPFYYFICSNLLYFQIKTCLQIIYASSAKAVNATHQFVLIYAVFPCSLLPYF